MNATENATHYIDYCTMCLHKDVCRNREAFLKYQHRIDNIMKREFKGNTYSKLGFYVEPTCKNFDEGAY